MEINRSTIALTLSAKVGCFPNIRYKVLVKSFKKQNRNEK